MHLLYSEILIIWHVSNIMTTILTCTNNILTCGIIFPCNVNKSKNLPHVIIVCFKKKHMSLYDASTSVGI